MLTLGIAIEAALAVSKRNNGKPVAYALDLPHLSQSRLRRGAAQCLCVRPGVLPHRTCSAMLVRPPLTLSYCLGPTCCGRHPPSPHVGNARPTPHLNVETVVLSDPVDCTVEVHVGDSLSHYKMVPGASAQNAVLGHSY